LISAWITEDISSFFYNFQEVSNYYSAAGNAGATGKNNGEAWPELSGGFGQIG
jgi:hypothetical protein